MHHAVDIFWTFSQSGFRRNKSLVVAALVAVAIGGWWSPSAALAIPALVLEDYATLPMTGSTAFPASPANAAYLARVNFLAQDPINSDRFYVNDLNGPLYMLDKNTRSSTEYLNFNGRGGNPGLFDRLWTDAGFAGGFVTFEFDPDYANNGKFYTAHVEQGTGGSQVPTHPNLDTSNWGTTAPVLSPGPVNYQLVLSEWMDTNLANNTFEGSARELLRVNARDRIHPIGDIIFNPTAGPGDPDWRVMYVSIGDAGGGENSDFNIRRTPQLLSALGGKILRIVPDLNHQVDTSTVSPNGKYRIPNDNPFTDVADADVRDEIFALGLRNPHRMTWDVDPNDSDNSHLVVSDIGLHTWEEINIIEKGGNYGYSAREGNELLGNGTRGQPPVNVTGPLPDPDQMPYWQLCSPASGFSTCSAPGPNITPIYPVLQYGHRDPDQDQVIAGDAIADGFVYRGTIPGLDGKFIFGDITTGALYYSEWAEMLAAHDGDPSTLAEIHPLAALWDDPNDAPDDGQELYTTIATPTEILGPMHQIVRAGYVARGGLDPNLPGGASVTGAFGRADIRLLTGPDGEIYITSKSDGMIRTVVGWVPEPTSAMLLASAMLLVAATRRGLRRA